MTYVYLSFCCMMSVFFGKTECYDLKAAAANILAGNLTLIPML